MNNEMIILRKKKQLNIMNNFSDHIIYLFDDSKNEKPDVTYLE